VENGAYMSLLMCMEGKECRCFEDRERTLGEILSLFYETLYL
jgi:hypothetical protein